MGTAGTLRLKLTSAKADADDVTNWLTNLKQAMSGQHGQSPQIRSALHRAQRTRARVELVEPTRATDDPPLVTNIELVDESDFVIGQPTVGGFTKPLVTGAPLLMTFALNDTRYQCETKSLGRAKIPSGGARPFFGYRLAFPERLTTPTDRREHDRVRVGIDLAPPAEFCLTRDPDTRYRGVIHNIGAGGVQIRTTQWLGRLSIGDEIVIRTELPPPVGAIIIVAEVRHRNDINGKASLGVDFKQEVPGMAELVRELRHHRAQRRRSA